MMPMGATLDSFLKNNKIKRPNSVIKTQIENWFLQSENILLLITTELHCHVTVYRNIYPYCQSAQIFLEILTDK